MERSAVVDAVLKGGATVGGGIDSKTSFDLDHLISLQKRCCQIEHLCERIAMRGIENQIEKKISYIDPISDYLLKL